MSKSFKIFLIIIPILIVGYFALGFGFGCGLGGGHNFDCRIIGTSYLISTWLCILLGLVMIVSLYSSKKISRMVLTLFVVALVIPPLLSLVYGFATPEQKTLYFEGMTVSSCDTGKPSVPWGRVGSRELCYVHYGICEKVTDSYDEQLCYSSRVFLEYSDCGVYKNYYNKLACQTAVAQKKNDLNFCATIVNQDPKQSNVELRHNCVIQVTGASDIRPLVVSKLYNASGMDFQTASYCQVFSGFKRDMCYEDVSVVHQYNFWCSLISSSVPWYKENCLAISKSP